MFDISFKRTAVLTAAVLGLLTLVQTAEAASDWNTSVTNPAAVSVRLDVGCDVASVDFEKKISALLKKAPYMQDVRGMNRAEWAVDGKSQYYKTYGKKMYVSVNPNMSREFPITFMTIKGAKTECVVAADGTRAEGCTDSISYTASGSDALSYRKAVESSKNVNFLKSFNLTFYMVPESKSACRFTSQLYVIDNTYLWAKRHLIRDIDPNIVEAKILSRFVDWSKMIVPELEVK